MRNRPWLLAAVVSSIIQVASSELLALSVSSSSPGQLDVVFGSAAVTAGAAGASQTSCGVLNAWIVTVTELGGASTDVDVGANCNLPTPSLTGHTCQLGLQSNTDYTVEVLEECNETEARNSSSSSVRTLPQPASAPNLVIADVSRTSLSIEWSSGGDGDCIFQSWEAEWRPFGGSWMLAENETGTSELLTGLQENAAYEFRVRQLCTDSSLNSAYADFPESLLTLPGIFSVFVGTSTDTRVIQLSYGPSRCRVLKQCCGDQFTVCHTGEARKTVTLSRMDVMGGWGQPLWLQCTAQSVADYTTFTEVQAPAPLWLQLHEATATTMKAKYRLGYIIDETATCDCATLSLELRADDSDVWNFFPGQDDSCTITGTRDCFLIDALPDKKYWGRMKMACENSSVDSEYVYTEDYIITPPACIWSTHTGQWGQPDQFECVDGTYCSETDASCCVPHGGRIRCPASTPFMCHNPFDCADSQERCCKATAEECNDHGGLRTCEVPAKTPLLTQVESLGPASLTISWEPQEYLIGYSSCQFLEWRVAISQVHIYGEGQWIWMRECDTRDYNKRSCTIENLRSLTDYNVRVWAQCTVVELSSYPNRTTVAVGTRPIPAVPPSALFCTGLEPLRFYADWWASDPEDCEFVAWELEAQLLPRTAGFTADGLFEGAAPGGEYETKCVLYDRDLRECWVTDLLADRDYKIRVRETCTNPLANSEFFVRYQECATLTMPAFNPENLTHYNEDLYTFEVSWDPGDPKACIFQYWEVQVKVNDTDWPAGDDPPVFGCRVLQRSTTKCMVHVGLNSGKAFQVRMREACTVRRLYTDWVYYDEVVETRLPVPASMPENLTANSTSPNHDISFASLDVAWDAHPPGECIFTGWKVETRIHDRNRDWEESSECRANPREPFECQITQGLLSNVYYDMRITETCVDPNALGDTLTVLDIARTRPVPAVAPFIVSVYATSARSLGVRISQRAAGQCVFEAYKMEWKMQGWDYWLPYDDCTPRSTTTCSVSGFPASQSYYTVRMKESCTDPMADSPWVEWPDFVLTWPEPAQIPSNFTAVELTAYNMTFTFEPGLGLDCTWSSWEVQILQGDAGPLATEWMDLTECYLPFRENVTCSVTNLQSFTVYQVRVRERCTDFIYDSDWGYSDPIMTTMPVQAGMPVDMRIVPNSITAFFFDVSWQAGASGQCIFKEWVMEVYQTSPDPEDWAFAPLPSLQDPPGVWVRHACGASRSAPICRPGDLPRTLKQNSTYAVRVQETCTDPNANGDFTMLSENATTIIATIPADPPENLTVSNETAYTFLLEFDAGEPYDCYFTGWAVEVRENWTDGNFSNETNYTELNYSLWVPRDECKNEEAFPRNRMRCVVPRLRKHSIYDAKVRETCYDGYTELLDSDFSSELPDRQAETLVPVAATSPFGLVSLSQGPYSFSLAWSAGDPKDCLYQKWLVEIKDDNYTGDVWREAIECGREARDVTSCTITMLHEGYLGEEAHLRSNTEYEVRVKEFCQTYTSIYDPWGGSRERAEYLDSPIHYLPADQLPRTLAPVPTLTPLNFKVNETDHQSFRLSWEAQISNDCRFRNWTVEIRLVIHCIAGVGYTNCTAVEDQPWEIPGTCVIEDRSVTSCKVHDVKSYSFYEVKMRERCSDATAESADATLIAEVWPFLSDAPDNMTVTSPEPFTLNVKWDPGDPQECVFSHWDVQVQGRRVGDLDDTFSRESVTDKWYGMIWDLEGNASFLNWSTTIDSCRLVGQRDVAECNITGLISNALYDVRIAERCVDERADSPWLVERLQATIPAWALMPLGPNVSNVTTTTMDLEWAASEPRDCLFSSWKVEVKPTAITDDDWIPVPECSLPDRDATSCQIVGLQSYTSYDIRIQETCIHDTSNSPYLLEENSFTTLVGSVVYVGTNPNTNSKAIFFGSRGLNACAYHTKCCADEFSLCYSSQEVDVIRTDLPDAGWGQDLYLSCVADTVAQDDMKRIVARPPAKLEAVDRTANSIDLVWLPYGSGGYMSDCYCSEWNIFVRRQGTTEWLLSPDCRNMPFSQSSCTVQNLEDNWLAPNTVYEIRVRQTCSFDRLSSPYKEIQVPTLPGCTFSQHSGRDDYFVCADGFFSFIFDGGRFDGDGTGCWRRGGRARCAKNFPYMCASPDSCAKVDSLQSGGVRADHCCMTEPCGSRNGGDRVCLVRPLPPADIVVTSPSPYSLMVDWQEQDFADTTYYPCSFRRWQVDLSQYFFEHWSSEWTAAPECYIEERRTSHCTITGLESNALYYVRVREVCQDDALNGDYLQHPGLVQVNPLPAGAVTDVIEAHRDIYWINVTWTPGLPNDCVFVAWQIEAVAGGETRTFTTVGQPRLPAYLNMTGLTDGTVFQIFVTEVCENPLANSAAVEALVSSRPNPAQDPQQPTVTAAGSYWLNVEWSAGQPGTCTFLSWEVTVRKTGTEQFDHVAVCSETAESTTSCNITESYSCFQDRKYSGFYDVCIPGVACPITDVQSATDCKLLCSYEPACRALRFQAAYGHCWLIDSSYNPLEDNPIYQTTGCARNLGLASLTGYEVQVAHRCSDPEADSSPAIVEPGLAPNHTTVGHATQPEDVEERSVHGRTIRIHFVPGVLRDYMPIRDGGPRLEMDDSTDCVFKKWAVQVRLNASEAPSDGPVSCWQYPMFCEQVWHTVPTTCADMYRETSWCDVHVIWSEELYQLRLREECQDPAADSPYTADPIWVTSGRALPAENVENLTAYPFLAGHNVSVVLDWDAGEANDCVFTGWELELRPAYGEWFLAEECISSLYEDVNCTVTEGLQSETTYDTRVRSYCLDLLSKGNWTEVLELFTTPAIPADPPLVRVETLGPRQMRFSMEPQDPWDCAFVAYVGELSEADTGKVVEHQRGDEDDWRPANESLLCMPAARVGAECLLDGLMSNTTYKVRICENCSNPQAEVCAEAMNTTLTLNPDAVRSVQVVFRSETHAHVNFISGDQPGDCNAEDWLFEYYNESWQFAALCTRMPGARTPQQCHLDLSMLDEEREYWMRVQELCVGGLQAPHMNFTLPAWEAESGSFMAEKDVSNMSNGSNMSEMEEEEEDDWWESNYSNYSMENVTMMNMTGHMYMGDGGDMDVGMNMSETNMSEPMAPTNLSMAGMNASDLNMSEMHQPDMNETAMNESDTGGYGADMNDTDTDENDTDENESEMNVTDMAEWVNSSYGNGSNDSQVSSSSSEGGNDVVASAEKSLGCSVFGCLWTLGDWSECSTGCGEGTRTRSVSCPSGNIEDCPKPMPETASLCFATQNCSWVLSSWTQCNATCGAGVEELQWTCPTGSEADCGALPSTHRNCYATSGCMWQASNWSTCSSQCGYGTRERTVTCSGMSEEDCGRARPDATEVCHETAACSWVEGEWSSCSSMCGQGFRTRNVSCSSGILADCDSLQPAILESCYNISGCQWSVSSWSACSSSCGTGYVNRTVACESGAKADCLEPEPTSSEACQDSSGCGNWTASDWSTCNVSCGTGFQERTVACVAGICPGDGPAHMQSCVNTTGCFWQPGEWSNCSTSCGSGVRSRTLYCPTGSAQDCGESPGSYEACLDTSGCMWQVGDWSSCDGDGCGQRVRAVYCQSGQDEDCQTSRPSNISTCDLEVCLAPAAESASFDVVLEVNNETNASALAGSLQQAVADSLQVPVEAVSVEPVLNGRRLASLQTLQFIVQVRDVSRGLAEFLSSETSLQAVAVDVAQELTQTGIPAGVQLVAREPTTTAAPPWTTAPPQSTTEPPTTTSAAADVTSSAQSTRVSTSQGPGSSSNLTGIPGLIKEEEVSPTDLRAGLDNPEGSPLLAVGLGAVAVLFLTFGYLLWHGRRRQKIVPEGAKGAWTDGRHIQYPWDSLADGLAKMIWSPPEARGKKTKLEEDHVAPPTPTDFCRRSVVGQSPDAVQSAANSLSGSLGSEAGQVVAAAASQVRATSTVTAAAAQMRVCEVQASGGSEGGSTRPSSGNSQQPKPPQNAEQPALALPLPRSPMRRMDWPEANPVASNTALRSTASPSKQDSATKWELMPPSTTPPAASPPRAKVAAVRVLRKAPDASARAHMSPPPLPTLPPTAVRIASRKGSSSAQEPPESERSRASSWEASRTPPVSHTPRSEGDKAPPPDALGGEGTFGARSP